MKRISFSKLDARHLYEYLIQYWITDVLFATPSAAKDRFGACPQCERIGKRLQRLIGPREARRIRTLLREQASMMKKKKKKG